MKSACSSSIIVDYERGKKKHSKITEKSVICAQAGLWKEGKIHFTTVNVKDDILHENLKYAFREFENKVENVRWIRIHKINPTIKHYVDFVESKTCKSYVGCIHMGKQPIEISSEYPKGSILHEQMHCCGFDHTHCRTDRDDHVNVDKSMENDINYLKVDCTIGEYDYESIMHYPMNENLSCKNKQKK
eukprot:449236_1